MNKTGATRYQKFLKAERAKTKLKGKKDKELPKGTNITKTNFKIKKIVIKEQLKKHNESEALSSRKLNIKELLSRLNHFNTNSRTDALDGLRELMISNPDILNQNLGRVIHAVTALVLNVEKVVRQAAFKVLHIVLSNVAVEKVDPFFDIMSTYLRSAMTHIDSRIQEDSLLFLDILLLCIPARVAQDFHKIIPNFLDMISKLRGDSKPGRTLTINLSNQNTSMKWRIKVFQRLQNFLQQYAASKNLNGNENKCFYNHTTFDNHKANHYTLFNPSYTSNCSMSCFTGKNFDKELQLDEIEKLQEYLETLIPLLFETWLEACPNTKSHTNFETVINEETGQLLKHILQTVTLLKNLVKFYNRGTPKSNIENLVFQKYKSSFSQNFVNFFPYVINVRSKQCLTNGNDEPIDPKLITENLEICHLFIIFNPNVHLKNQNREITSVLNYIERTFNQNTDAAINDIIINILNTIFSKTITNWTKSSSVLDALFRKIVWIYFNKMMSDCMKQSVFSLLCKIALNENLSHFHSSDAFDMWLKHLPDILLEEKLTLQTVNIIHKFAVSNNKVFNAVIKSKLLAIIRNFPKIVIIDSTSDTSSYHKLLSLFYWIKVWDTESLNLLESQLMESVYKPDHGKYIFDTLRFRSSGIL